MGARGEGWSFSTHNQGYFGSGSGSSSGNINVNSNNHHYQDNRVDNRVDNRYIQTTNNFDGGVNALLKPLSPLESVKRHQAICETRLDTAGTWFTEKIEFLLWRNGPEYHSNPDQLQPSSILCCYGDPGVGKTVLSSIVIENLFKFTRDRFKASRGGAWNETVQESNFAVLLLYCDYRDHQSQTIRHILGSFLQQLLLSSSIQSVPEEVQSRLVAIKKSMKQIEHEDILEMLKITLNTGTPSTEFSAGCQLNRQAKYFSGPIPAISSHSC
ncbi:hypothetical protein DFH27DRAFT_52281 [Peziza echinospora]|nr:hypothetical protein DFH27DRAFT_52281 [Peziza echinospora]